MRYPDHLLVEKYSGTALPPLVVKVMQCECDEPAQGETDRRICGVINAERYATESTEVTALLARFEECLREFRKSYDVLVGRLNGLPDTRDTLTKVSGEVCTPSRLEVQLENRAEAYGADETVRDRMHDLMCMLAHLVVRVDAVRCCVHYLEFPVTPDQNKTGKPGKSGKPAAAKTHAKAE